MEEAKPQILLWTVPECALRITVPAHVINEIRILAVEAFYSVPRGGVEIGGVFFGIHDGASVQIRAHRQIQCQYASGPSFTLSGKDQFGLSAQLEQATADPELAGTVPVGWYHSHTRSEIFLSPADVQLYNDFFPERWQIAMVLRPTNLQPTRAGFFFRDRIGGVKADAPVQEFKLEPPDFGLAPFEAAPVKAAVVTPAVPSVPEPTVNRDMVNLASKAAVALAATAVGAPPVPARALRLVPPPPAIVEPAVVQPAASVPVPVPALVAGSAAPAVESVPATVTAPWALAEGTAAVPAADVSLPSFLASSTQVEKRTTNWIWMLVVVVLLCAAGAGAFLKWGHLAKPSDLGLETYDINGAFLIRWDRESSVVRSASQATLEIEDGGEKTPVTLTRAELRAGGYGYVRRTSHVSVRLKVEGEVPAEEFSNFSAGEALGSQTAPASGAERASSQAVAEKEQLKTQLINESMQTLELRRENTSLRQQLAEERAKSVVAPAQ